jgi:hypothetical protein
VKCFHSQVIANNIALAVVDVVVVVAVAVGVFCPSHLYCTHSDQQQHDNGAGQATNWQPISEPCEFNTKNTLSNPSNCCTRCWPRCLGAIAGELRGLRHHHHRRRRQPILRSLARGNIHFWPGHGHLRPSYTLRARLCAHEKRRIGAGPCNRRSALRRHERTLPQSTTTPANENTSRTHPPPRRDSYGALT